MKVPILNIYVVEDIALTRMALIQNLEELGHHLAGSAASAEKAWQDMQGLPLDLALIDINLAGKESGIWLAHQLRVAKPEIAIVFLTAFGDLKTLEKILDIKPEGYLVKPYTQSNVEAIIPIAYQHSRLKIGNTPSAIPKKSELIFKTAKSHMRFEINQILYLMSDGNYVHVISADGKKQVLRVKLNELLALWEHPNFVLVHVRYAINSLHIKHFQDAKIKVGASEIPVSKKYLPLVKKWLTD